MGLTIVVLAAVGLAGVAAAIYLIGVYNELIALKVNVDKSWANIDVIEKQRYDELPKLVKVCEGYMKFERETLEKVIEARTRFLSAKGPADVAQADSALGGALKSLFAVAENYPELKANQNFMQLQQRISHLEDQIADRREFYNDSVNIHNTRIQQVPYVFLAGVAKTSPREMYKVAAEEKKSPDIDFSFPK